MKRGFAQKLKSRIDHNSSWEHTSTRRLNTAYTRVQCILEKARKFQALVEE